MKSWRSLRRVQEETECVGTGMRSKTKATCDVPGRADQPAHRINVLCECRGEYGLKVQQTGARCRRTHPHADGGKYAVAVAKEELVPRRSHAADHASVRSRDIQQCKDKRNACSEWTVPVVRREGGVVLVSEHQLERPADDPQAGDDTHDLDAVVLSATRHCVVVPAAVRLRMRALCRGARGW